MKLNLTTRRKWLLGAGAAVFFTAAPAFALFGVGDIVFDPTSYASLVSQLTPIESQYKMLQNNLEHFTLKQLWQTELHALENVNVANMFGETAGIKIALNANNPSASLTGWQTATVPMNSNASTYLAGQQLGSSRMSQFAMIETSDAVSPDCLTAVGQYHSGRTTNLTSNNSLLSNQFDNTPATNAEVQQLNLLNASEGQRMAEVQSQGALQACLAGQMTVANMERRNAATEDLNTAAFVQQQRTMNDTSAANEGSTWDTYLP